MKRVESLPVIFRAERAGECRGEITAVFPTIAADYAGRYFETYARLGQHGSGGPDWYAGTRAARPDEFRELERELRRIYEAGPDPVRLIVRKRFAASYRRAWQANARAARDRLQADPTGGPWSPAARAETAAAIAADRESI